MQTERLLGVLALAGAALAAGCGGAPSLGVDVTPVGSGGTNGTGTGGADSAGGTGAGGSSGSGADSGCVDLSHFDVQAGDPTRPKWDLRVIGTGFEADEGNTVRVVVTLGEPSYGLGEAVIRSGSFDIFLPGTIEPYTGIGVYIDRGRDNACNVDADGFWQRTTGGVGGDYVWNLTPDERFLPGLPLCSINAIFDLTRPLPCP